MTVPVLARASGAFPRSTPFPAAAGLALPTAVVPEAHASLELTPRFAVEFTVVTTPAFAGTWAVGVWAADAFPGTTHQHGTDGLVWDLTTATAMGVAAGVVFEACFGGRSGSITSGPPLEARRATVRNPRARR